MKRTILEIELTPEQAAEFMAKGNHAEPTPEMKAFVEKVLDKMLGREDEQSHSE